MLLLLTLMVAGPSCGCVPTLCMPLFAMCVVTAYGVVIINVSLRLRTAPPASPHALSPLGNETEASPGQ